MRNNKILIIDDDEMVIGLIRSILKEEGYKIFSAKNGKEGLDLLTKEQPVVILLDLYMSIMDGFEFLESIKLHQSKTFTVIVLTGHNDSSSIERSFNLGVSSFILKPFDTNVIKGVIKNSIELKEAQLELMKYSKTLEAKIEERTKILKDTYDELKISQAIVVRQEKLASLGTLAAGVAHEINNPTSFIASNLNTLKKYIGKFTDFISEQSSALKSDNIEEAIKNVDNKRRELKIDYIIDDVNGLIEESLDGANRITKMVKNLKIFSRQDEEKLDKADINKCIESSLNMVWNELKYKCTIKKELGTIKPTECYPQQLNQVFMNLLVNAAQSIDKQGVIIIKTWEKEDSIFISVSDTGCGIPEENLDKIFDPFFTTKEEDKGTGLGMSISHDIIKRHNGDIMVKSEIKKGSTFTIRMPVVESL